MKNKPYQTGMTLIEIMIALLIGAFLLGGVLQIFIRQQTNLQNAGRFIQIAGKRPVCDGFFGAGYPHGGL